MKKVTAVIMVIIILMDLTSCHAYIDLAGQEDYKAYQDKKHVYVTDLQTNQDTTINFSASSPGKIINGEVKGLPFHQVTLLYCKTDTIIFENSKARYIHKNGNMYMVIKQNKNGYTAITSDTIRIPFSDIKQMHIKETYPDKSALLVSGIAGVSVGIIALITILSFNNMTLWSGW
jgi:hypothetical protein